MNSMRYLIGLIVAGLLWVSCSKEIGPSGIDLNEVVDTTLSDSVGVLYNFQAANVEEPQSKNVLIEEFTGIACQNCPQGHLAIEAILDANDNVVAISIHAGVFADPEFYSKIHNDLRTEDGNAIEQYFGGVKSFPAAVINRKIFDGETSLVLNKEKWSGYVTSETALTTSVNLYIERISYDEATKKVTFTVRAHYTEASKAVHHLSIAIVEDDVVTNQLDGAAWVDEYEQPHVLRDMLTSATGLDLTGDRIAGTSYSYQLVYTVDDAWDASKCHIYAYVHNFGEDKSVLHVIDAAVSSH